MEAMMHDDEIALAKHHKLLNLTHKESIEIIFFGDSITRRWEDNKDLWDKYFSGYVCANFGVGGDQLENMKWRIENQELDEVDPRLFVCLMGTNNITDASVDSIKDGILEIVEMMHGKCAGAKILLMALFPREKDEKGRACLAKIEAINAKVKGEVDKNYVKYVDLGRHFLLADGRVNKAIMPDGLHPNYEGYQMLGPILRQEIDEMMIAYSYPCKWNLEIDLVLEKNKEER